MNKELERLTLIPKQQPLKVLKTTQKPLLTELLFVQCSYIGTNNEGHWNSFHMSMKLKVALRVLFSEYEVVFLFYCSHGHARKRNGTLNAIQMSRGTAYGGAQAIIKDTTILDADGSLGPKSVLSTLAMFNPLFSSLVTMDHPICYLSNNKSDGTSDQQGRSNKLNG